MGVSRRFLLLAAVVSVFAVLAAPTTVDARGRTNGTACVVADPAGFDDGTLNQAVLRGARKASRLYRVELVTADPGTEESIAAQVEEWTAAGACDLIIGVGFIVGGVIEPTVAANSQQRFALIDSSYTAEYPNVASVLFRVDQAAFLAGYVAAAANETGKVGTYGGLPIPGVTDYMNGYALGVEYHNVRRGTDVEVLGWDVESQDGLFSGTFTDPEVGAALADELYGQGADTIMPVSGGTGRGTYDAAVARKLAGDDVRVVYVDFDPFWLFDRDPAGVLLTSAVKRFGVAAAHQIKALARDTWEGGMIEEDLASGGVGIAPFHRTRRQLPPTIWLDLLRIRRGIIDGTIPTLPDIGDACGQPVASIEPITMVNGDVLFSQTDGKLWTYEPDTGTLSEHPLPFGGVWDIQWNGGLNTRILIANSGQARILELDLRTGEFEEVLCGAPLEFPLGVGLNPADPNELWIADSAGVIRHDRVTGDTAVVVEPVAQNFDGIAVSKSGDGQVYVTDSSSILYRVAPGEPNDVEVVADVAGYGLNGLVFDEGLVFDGPNTLIATSIRPSAIVDIDVQTGSFDVRDFSTDMRSSEDADFTRSGDLFIIDSGLVGEEFGVDAGLYLLPRGSSSIIELIRGAPLGDTVDILVARNVFPDVGE